MYWGCGALVCVAYLYSSFVRTEFNLYPLIRTARGHVTATHLSSWRIRDFSMRRAWMRRAGCCSNPRTGQPRPGTLPTLLGSMNETIEISLVGTFLSVLISFPLAFLAARNLTRGTRAGPLGYSATRALFNVTRAFPPYILAIIFVIMVGPGRSPACWRWPCTASA